LVRGSGHTIPGRCVDDPGLFLFVRLRTCDVRFTWPAPIGLRAPAGRLLIRYGLFMLEEGGGGGVLLIVKRFSTPAVLCCPCPPSRAGSCCCIAVPVLLPLAPSVHELHEPVHSHVLTPDVHAHYTHSLRVVRSSLAACLGLPAGETMHYSVRVCCVPQRPPA
jgi:hypothetical protein